MGKSNTQDRLLDIFAKEVMLTLLEKMPLDMMNTGFKQSAAEGIAAMSYMIADEMLKARSRYLAVKRS